MGRGTSSEEKPPGRGDLGIGVGLNMLEISSVKGN